MSHITPQEALRMARVLMLATKHGATFDDDPEKSAAAVITHSRLDPATGKLDPLLPRQMAISDRQLANLIDEATAAKDATIKALRKEVQDAYKEAQQEARDAYSQGQGDEAERHRDNY